MEDTYAKVSSPVAFLTNCRRLVFNVLLVSKSEPQRKRAIMRAFAGFSWERPNPKRLMCCA